MVKLNGLPVGLETRDINIFDQFIEHRILSLSLSSFTQRYRWTCTIDVDMNASWHRDNVMLSLLLFVVVVWVFLCTEWSRGTFIAISIGKRQQKQEEEEEFG